MKSSRRKTDGLFALEANYEAVLRNVNMSGEDILSIGAACETSRFLTRFFAEAQEEKQKESQYQQRQAQEFRASKASARAKQQMLRKLTRTNDDETIEEGIDFDITSFQRPDRILAGKAPSESRKLEQQLERVKENAKIAVKKPTQEETLLVWDNQDDVYWAEGDSEGIIEDFPNTDDEGDDSRASPPLIHQPLQITSSPSPISDEESDDSDDVLSIQSPSSPPTSFSYLPNLPNLPKTLLPSSSSSSSDLPYSQHFGQSPDHFVLSSLLSQTPQTSSLRSPSKLRKRKRETAEELQNNLNTDFLQTKLNASKKSQSSSSPSSTSSSSPPSSLSPSPAPSSSKRKIQDDQALSLQALRLYSSLHHSEKQHQLAGIRRSFPLWLSSLTRGRNLLLYGFGSKKVLIESFLHDGLVQNFPCLVVNGYHQGFSLKGLLDGITADLLGHEGVTFSTPLVQCEFIGQYFEACFPRKKKSSIVTPTSSYALFPHLMTHLKPEERKRIQAPEHVFIAIHNLEKVGGYAVHNVLSLLASVPQIHLIASADHIFTPLDWDDGVKNRYNWVCEHTPTYQPYYYETRDDSFFDQTSSNKEECIRLVLNTLGKIGWDCFCVLATSTVAKNGKRGLSFAEWLLQCGDRGIITSEEALRNMIKEFKDHFFLKEVSKEGQPFLRLIASSETLQNLLKNRGEI